MTHRGTAEYRAATPDEIATGIRYASIEAYREHLEPLKTELEHYFRPEFLNRVDEVVVFHKLNHGLKKR